MCENQILKLAFNITNRFAENASNVRQKGGRNSFNPCKGGRTPTASRQASRHETKETKADVSIMTQTGVRWFS
jgi:hypothetical protein